MAQIPAGDSVVDARIVYWGIEGSGKSTNLRAVHGKLRPDHRGELQEMPTRTDPSVTYELLPIELGEIAGVRTRIQMIAVPGHPEQSMTRKQLLDEVDGIVLVLDAQRERIEENVASFEELRRSLSDYGRALSDVPLVVQYNKRDLADPYALEELHRKLDLEDAPVFEAVASDATGVLQTLSTISKQVIRSLRERAAEPAPAPPPRPSDTAPAAGEPRTRVDAEEPTPPALKRPGPTPAERMEEAILEEAGGADADASADLVHQAERGLDRSWDQLQGEIERPEGARLGPDLTIVSVGEATRCGERAVRLPLVLGDAEGRTTTVQLTLQIDPLVDEERG